MCGIYAIISQNPTSISAPLQRLLCNRGPDYFGTTHFRLCCSPSACGVVDPLSSPIDTSFSSCSSPHVNILLATSVLSLRASCPSPQPALSTAAPGAKYADVSSLCWNGEAWKVGDTLIVENDTAAIRDLLSSSVDHDDLIGRLRTISGPFAAIFVCQWPNRIRLYAARDRLGRRSLLLRRDTETCSLAFSSVGDGQTGWKELPADGIYWLDVSGADPSSRIQPESLKLVREDWVESPISLSSDMVSSLGLFNMSVPDLELVTVGAEVTAKLTPEDSALVVVNTATGAASGAEVAATSLDSITGLPTSSATDAPRPAITATSVIAEEPTEGSTTVVSAVSGADSVGLPAIAPTAVSCRKPRETASEPPTKATVGAETGPTGSKTLLEIALAPSVANASAGADASLEGTIPLDSTMLKTSVSPVLIPSSILEVKSNSVRDDSTSTPVAASLLPLASADLHPPSAMMDATHCLRTHLTNSLYVRASSIPEVSHELLAREQETRATSALLTPTVQLANERGVRESSHSSNLDTNLGLHERHHRERLGAPESMIHFNQVQLESPIDFCAGPSEDTITKSISPEGQATTGSKIGIDARNDTIGQTLGSEFAEAHAPVPSQARAAVLFSGGLDCTVLARLLSEILPAGEEIDLINVAFENPRIAAQFAKEKKSIPDIYEECPDRITGRRAFDELQKCCPERRWRFIAANIPFVETTRHKDTVVALMAPHNTEMDLSIANALYFAARGTGHFYCSWDSSADSTGPLAVGTTAARVLFSGLGADELFGGYVRHSTAFSRRGYAGLVEELKLDVARLGQRNLGRDDRVLSHWSRETRFPFLDEDLVRWAIERPVQEKCDFHVDDAVYGGIEAAKRVLRVVADDLGLHGAAREKKRAIQFGARTAKMQSGRVKGTAAI